VQATIGAAFASKEVAVRARSGAPVRSKLLLWDTAGLSLVH
jgi:hypothetical protein